MSEEKKIYFPKSSAKKVEFRSGGSILKVGLHVDAACEFLRKHCNDKGYINLGISARKQVGQYGDTHCIWLDTWKPTQQAQPKRQDREERQPEPEEPPTRSEDDDRIPF